MNSVFDRICVINNIITDDELKKISYFLNVSKNWGFQTSNPDDDQTNKYRFLMLELDKYKYFTNILFTKIQSHIGVNFQIERVYANAQYYGMPGRPHFDSDQENAYTFLLYVNDNWNVLWGGQTIFFDKYITPENEDITLSNKTISFFPKPKTGVFFPSNIYHYAESPTKDCFDFRFTIAYKMKMIDDDSRTNKS